MTNIQMVLPFRQAAGGGVDQDGGGGVCAPQGLQRAAGGRAAWEEAGGAHAQGLHRRAEDSATRRRGQTTGGEGLCLLNIRVFTHWWGSVTVNIEDIQCLEFPQITLLRVCDEPHSWKADSFTVFNYFKNFSYWYDAIFHINLIFWNKNLNIKSKLFTFSGTQEQARASGRGAERTEISHPESTRHVSVARCHGRTHATAFCRRSFQHRQSSRNRLIRNVPCAFMIEDVNVFIDDTWFFDKDLWIITSCLYRCHRRALGMMDMGTFDKIIWVVGECWATFWLPSNRNRLIGSPLPK